MSNRLFAIALALSLVTSVRAQNRLDVPPAAVDAAFGYLRAQAPARGLDAADVTELSVSDGHTSTRSGLTYVYVRQQLDGLDIDGAQVTVAVGRDGRVAHTAGDLVAGLAATADAAGSNRAASVSAENALRAAAGYARILLGTVSTEAAEGGPAQKTRFEAEGLSSPATARQVYVQTEGRALRRAWEVTLDDPRSEHHWVIQVDAATGAELNRYDLTVSESFGEAAPASFAPFASAASPLAAALGAGASGDVLAGLSLVPGYRVFPMPFASPLYVAAPPPADGRTTVSGAEDALASPFGWHDTNGAAGAEFTTTRGNNTHTYIDRNDDELPDTAYPAPDGGAALLFNFPITFTQAPSTYTLASATNLFYWSNIIHDVMYGYGFTEAAGNFQTNTYGRGGTGNDAVDSEVQSGADICNEANPCHNNANFSTPADGSRPRMQMYDGTNVTPNVDGSLDAHVVTHEYGHGISNRLVAGSSSVTCLQNSEQMGEGWSDWFGNMLTMRPGDTRTTRRPVGNYLFGQPATGVGIRPAPYTTDFAVNNYTYQRSRTTVAPHGVGFVWATILWEVTWDMIDAHGFNADLYNEDAAAGNQMMLNLVTEGLKLTPCNPGFVSGRDAILAADAALYPDAANPGQGLHYTTLWTAFARRGLGFSASQGSTSSNADNTEAFDLPLPSAVASIASSPISILRPAGGTATATVAISNTAAAGSQPLTVGASISAAASARPSGQTAPTGEIVTHGAAASAGKSGDTPASETTPGPVAGLDDFGTDGFGYSWTDSTEPGGPTYGWVDISTTGTPLTLGDDAASAAITLPFSFPFYGAAQTTLRIVSNGYLLFGTGGVGTNAGAGNPSIPTTAAPNAVLAPYWDDLNPGAGQVRYQNMGDGRFVVSWIGVPHYATTGETPGAFTFQAILYPSGQVVYQYQTITPGSFPNSATIGAENATGTVGVQVAFNTAFAASGKAVRISPPPSWATVTPTTATVAPGASTSLTVTLNAAGLTEGTYRANLIVTTNAPGAPTTTIPLTLTVGGQGVVAGGQGWRLLAAPATGVTVDNLAAVNLVQGVPGYYPTVGANLLTGYTGSAWTSAGTGTTLAPGRGFFWYFYNIEGTPGGPSTSHTLPTTLATTNPAVTTDTPVALHASGDKANLLGNPFGVSLRVDNVATWPGAGALASTVAQTWDAASSMYETSITLPTIAAWQGFWVEGATAGTLTIPASARTTGGVLQRTDPVPTVAFTLAQADGPLQDRAAVLAFPDGATADRDAFDASKLTPLAGTYVLAALGADGLRAVESLPAPTGTAVAVPLHVASVGAGTDLVLSWPLVEALPEAWAATLTDMQTGTTVDLRTAADYAFTVTAAPAGDPLAMPQAAALASNAVAAAPARFIVTVGPRGATAGESGADAVFALDAPAPNPARGATMLAFSLAEAGSARLSVVDLLGREVSVLVEGEQSAGRHTAALDVSALAPGVYVVRLSAGAQTATRRVVVVR